MLTAVCISYLFSVGKGKKSVYMHTYPTAPTPAPANKSGEGGTKEPVELRFVRLRPQEPGNPGKQGILLPRESFG